MFKHIFFIILSTLIPGWILAQCAPGQFKITISENMPICLTLTDGLITQHRVAQGVWNNSLQQYEIQVYVCQGNSNNLNVCGFTMDTGICYFLKPFDWNISDPPPLQIRLNSAACSSGLSGMQLEYSHTNRQLNLSAPGNGNAYSLYNCRPCAQDIIISSSAIMNTLPVESSTWIKTSASLLPDPNLNIRWDANPEGGYIELNDGISIEPQNGIFIASCVDGCGPRDPYHKQLQAALWLEGYYTSTTHHMAPVMQNQGLNADPGISDLIQISLKDSDNTQTLFETDAYISTQGVLSSDIPYSIQDAVYLQIKHRNSTEIYSAATRIEIPMEYPCIFTQAANQVYGSNQVELEPGVFGIFSGDINQDGVVDGLDYNDWETDSNNFAGGYFSTDLNGDGIVDGLDFIYWEQNSNNFVGVVVP
ncbi:MAG: hypothetical protein IPN26_11250 [Bacteroidetes bacterium]|nr:hypothetical protein [Bacteroidota bacterium]